MNFESQPEWRNGRRSGLKIRRGQPRASSTLASGIFQHNRSTLTPPLAVQEPTLFADLRVHPLSLVPLLVISVNMAAAQGGPPLVTDDPGTAGPGRWELNVALTWEHGPGESVYEAPLLDLNYGVGDRLQLKWELPLRVVASAGSAALGGVGNSLLGIKWRFAQGKVMALSTYPQLELNNPTSSVSRGVADRGKRLFLPVELAKSLGRVGINGEVGYEIAEDNPDRWTYGLAAGYQLSRSEVLAECTAASPADFGETAIFCSFGARHPLARSLTGLIALGHRVSGPMEQQSSWRCYLGLQGRWGRSE